MKRFLPFILIGAILFIAGGDKVLPDPLGAASAQTRATINNALVGVFPSWKPRTNPNERTEKAIEEAQP
ncbi:hypothetical protein [Prochlorothrix hollandica]|uniref:Uncharacterized protein n=1 Tax=Prochlorothrix hollandica PCC 9006 = CALU 1027 TaxID=317619 RepID=A0A0M2PW47_PROHO|nr:hypothetical protein [Prochlorothrix hollandica]KKI98601.1 hypothetical protein PROH_17085 [Prochlorothrix hollandica PCC 9006 = CALU 1027]